MHCVGRLAAGIGALCLSVNLWAQVPETPMAAASAPEPTASAAATPEAQALPPVLAPVPAPVPAPTHPGLVAQDSVSAADTAWMMTSTALVLLMTLPGIALFYGGLVRRKSVVNTMASVTAIAALVSMLCYVVGYSLAFTPGNGWRRPGCWTSRAARWCISTPACRLWSAPISWGRAGATARRLLSLSTWA